MPEGDRHEVPADHPFLVEVARRDGMIRYAWRGGLTLDLGRLFWKRRDPSWYSVLERIRGVDPNDCDGVIRQAIGDMIDRGIPLGPYTRQFIKASYVLPLEPKDREKDLDRVLASVISDQLEWLVELLEDAGHKDPKKRAAAYVAPHWRKVVKEDGGHGRFLSGEALSTWLRRHRDPTKSTLKMSCARGRSKRSDDR
jgi:hypothetical protein